MTSITRMAVFVTGGVDTRGQSHHAAVIDHVGRQLGDREFPALPVGYGALVEWLQGHGGVDRVGVEGTGTYGAGLARRLRGAGDAYRRGRPPGSTGAAGPRQVGSAGRVFGCSGCAVCPLDCVALE